MTFNIQNFSSSIQADGIQHNSHFDIYISVPPILLGKVNQSDGFKDVSYNDQTRLLNMRCEGGNIPGIGLRTNVNNRYGVGIFEKYPFSAGFTDVNLSFINDKNEFIKKFFYTWQNLIFNFSDTKEVFGSVSKRYTSNFKSDYISTISINKYDKGGDKVTTSILTKAFPISLNDTPVSWQDNSISRTIVTFTFKDWYMEGSKVANAGAIRDFFN